MYYVISFFNSIRFYLIAPWIDWDNKQLKMDIERWKIQLGLTGSQKYVLKHLLTRWKEFRNLFIYRNANRSIYRKWIRLWYSPVSTLFLEAKEIGGGLFILHGFSTIISAERIGENCWISQQVTVGYNGHGKPPVIGNNVMIACGAKVLGDINIGDNVTIGANAVVIKDVEPDSVMGGVPAKRIR